MGNSVSSRQLVSIYKSPRRAETYLYVPRVDGLKNVPEALLDQFGAPVLVTHLLLATDRKLARANAARVLEEIANAGFYLQMPPPREDYLLDLYRDTSDRYEDMD